MTRKKARHLMLELNRRIYKQYHGTLKGFGQIAKHFSDDWRHVDYTITGGYKNSWNSPEILILRKSVGMQ